jgi:hypothetical protein
VCLKLQEDNEDPPFIHISRCFPDWKRNWNYNILKLCWHQRESQSVLDTIKKNWRHGKWVHCIHTEGDGSHIWVNVFSIPPKARNFLINVIYNYNSRSKASN